MECILEMSSWEVGQLELRAYSKYELQKRGNPKAGKKLNGKQEMLLHQRRHGVPELCMCHRGWDTCRRNTGKEMATEMHTMLRLQRHQEKQMGCIVLNATAFSTARCLQEKRVMEGHRKVHLVLSYPPKLFLMAKATGGSSSFQNRPGSFRMPHGIDKRMLWTGKQIIQANDFSQKKVSNFLQISPESSARGQHCLLCLLWAVPSQITN